MKYNSNSIDSIDVSASKCNFIPKEENHVVADCSFTIFNYGKVSSITIKPILPNYLNDSVHIEFERNTLTFDRHRKINGRMPFNGIQANGVAFQVHPKRFV